MADPQRTLASALPHDEETGRVMGRAHNRAVMANDVDVLRPTLSSWDTFRARLGFAVNGDLDFAAEFTPEPAEEAFRSHLREFEITSIHVTNEFHRPWYQFAEESFSWRRLGASDVHSTTTAYFKPAWTDGVLGLVYTQRPTWSEVDPDISELHRLSDQLDAFDGAWRDGDVDARLHTIDDDTRSAIGVMQIDGPRRQRAVALSKSELAEAWRGPMAGRVLELERLHHRLTHWVVFAGYRMVVEQGGRTVERETACLLPVARSGRFVGEMSYSLEIDL